MTRQEFEAAYARRSNLSIKQLPQLGMRAAPCNCGEESCEGWRMKSQPEWKPSDDTNMNTFTALDVVRIKDIGILFFTKLTKDYPDADALREDLKGPCQVIMDRSTITGTVVRIELNARMGPWKIGATIGILLG